LYVFIGRFYQLREFTWRYPFLANLEKLRGKAGTKPGKKPAAKAKAKSKAKPARKAKVKSGTRATAKTDKTRKKAAASTRKAK